MDSLVRAEVAAELRNNPEAETVGEAPEKKNSTPAVHVPAKITPKPVKVVHTPVKAAHTPAKIIHKPVSATHKPAKVTHKPVNAAPKTVKDKVIAKPNKITRKTVVKPAAP